MKDSRDAIVIGGGFYGATVAIYLARHRKFRKVLLIEREGALLMRASYSNQARVHNGYHYPRSFTTAYRSRINLPKFLSDWPFSVDKDIIKLYAIAKQNSKVGAKQFERFCKEIGANLQPADPSLRKLFNLRLIESVYLVEEYAFDSTKLAEWADAELEASGVDVRYHTQASAIIKEADNSLRVIAQTRKDEQISLGCRYVFNCTYSGINQLTGDFPGLQTKLKQEVTEMALMQMPDSLSRVGITVMDGPFFSVMPFPARSLHTLSHVRYTPHMHWDDEVGKNPYEKLDRYERATRVDRMIRDVSRFVPEMLNAKYVDSLFEIKTILLKNESDDGRPILFEQHSELPGCYSILGGKIDNIYDVIETLENERFNLE